MSESLPLLRNEVGRGRSQESTPAVSPSEQASHVRRTGVFYATMAVASLGGCRADCPNLGQNKPTWQPWQYRMVEILS